MHKIALIIATKDRPEQLGHLLRSLRDQTLLPEQIIIVDSGQKSLKTVIESFHILPIQYVHHLTPSATKQRNIGIDNVRSDITLVGFLDDDVELESDALKKMLHHWENTSPIIAGIAFNLENHPLPLAFQLKSLTLTEKLGLYSKKSGVILPSAFQTMIGRVNKNSFVQWLPTTAVVWRKDILKNYRFDEWFHGFSYLEDLDFSYRIGKKYRLMVLENARYYHYPDLDKKWNDYNFGKKEVANRVYIVRKFPEFSLQKCYLGLLMRTSINFISFLREGKIKYLKRTAGNIIELAKTVL